MKLLRALFTSYGCRTCGVCGASKEGPCEMYQYVDGRGKTLLACFDCRANCTPERTVESFSQVRGRDAPPQQ